MLIFARECLKNVLVTASTKKHTAIINQCWFSFPFFDYWLCWVLLPVRKNPQLTVNILRHSSTASWTFFPTHASSFIRVLEQTHLFPIDERKKERVGIASNCCLSTGDSHEGVGVGVGLGRCEGKRLRYEIILRSRTHFNYESNFQVARERSAYDLKRTALDSSKTEYEYPETKRSINHRSEWD